MPGTLLTRASIAALVGVTALAAYVTPAAAQQAEASGEVVRVNPEQGKIAIKHGAIKALELPAMTLFYQIDPALLKDIHVGDKVSFTASRQNGKYVITKISK